jgi:hypothetical protein
MNEPETISAEVETNRCESTRPPLNGDNSKAVSAPNLPNHDRPASGADLVQSGRQVYEKLKNDLESRQFGRFVAIDPQSECYFLGDTGTDALVAAHTALPEARFFPGAHWPSNRTQNAILALIETDAGNPAAAAEILFLIETLA